MSQMSCHEAEPWSVEVNALISGRYLVIRPLGRGSFGEVYEVADRTYARAKAAVKLFPEWSDSKNLHAKISREVLSLSCVEHPNVIRFYDIINDGCHLGYSMEMVNGVSLARINSGRAHYSIEEVKYLLIRLCTGTDAIHSLGLIHTDIKPENVLVTDMGGVKLADFGLVHVLWHAKDKIGLSRNGFDTEADGRVGGTLDYLAPEVAAGDTPTAAADIYSLGMIGFWLLTGSVLYEKLSPIHALQLRAMTSPPDLRALRSDCPEALARIVTTALGRTPAERYDSARDMMRDLLMNVGSKAISMGSSSFRVMQRVQEVVTPTMPDVLYEIPRDERTFELGRNLKRGQAIVFILALLAWMFALGIFLRAFT
jgi:eukaryotic-like serine/threonine-protein kinase